MATASPLALRMLLITSCAAPSWLTKFTATFAPRSVSSLAVAAPMPVALPVTSALVTANSFASCFSAPVIYPMADKIVSHAYGSNNYTKVVKEKKSGLHHSSTFYGST
jgi:hypothetical protein